ncbi:MAG: DUF445 family protein [Candidatus Electronema sp. V4]|uniref:DUF445 family protein n=1 Tax=Candidatus Electronema sp. V4 TaxID=3454756 RepID=UPI0040556CBF
MTFPFTAAQLLAYGGPPLIGAFIGYLTNEVAIKMLFRPLRPWRIFGIRVPLTPGVIPSKRHQLAENMGEMVGGKLLTPQDIGEALSAEPFQDHLHRLIENRVQDLLGRDFGPLLQLLPDRFRVHARIGLRALKHRLRNAAMDWLTSPALADALSNALAAHGESAGGSRLNELFQADERQLLYARLESLSIELLTAPEAAERLGGWLEQALSKAAAKGVTVGELLPAELRELLLAAAVDQTPKVLAQAAAIMTEPPMRERVAQAVRSGADHFIDSLGPMAAMAKGFINMQQLDSVIRTWLAEREGDLADWLQQPEIQARAAQALREQAEALLATPLAELLANIGPERLRLVCVQTAARLLTALAGGQLRQTLSAALREQAEALLAQGELSLTELAEKLLPPAGRRKLREAVAKELRTLAAAEPARQLVGKLISSLLDQLAARPAGLLRDLLPAEVRGGIAEHLTLHVNRLLIREVPGLTESLRISELVRNKVDSLDLLRLERLLLSIMEEQFKYINLFGALLGFLIGLLNLALLELF